MVVTGLLIAVSSFYFAWVSNTPDYTHETLRQCQLLSVILAAISLGVIILGCYMIIFSIKKINKEFSILNK